MPTIVNRQAVDDAYFVTEDVALTVKLYCQKQCNAMDILNMLRCQGIDAQNITGLFRGRPGDPGFYVQLGTHEALETLKGTESLSFRDKQFKMVALGSQVINLRIHWIPLYFRDTLIRTVLSDFGRVLRMERVLYNEVQTGMKVVQLEVNEAERLGLPHVIKFECGAAMLITTPGRPPLCLRCNRVGHIRKDCLGGDTLVQVSGKVPPRTAGPVSQGGQQEPPNPPPVREPVPPALDPAEGESNEVERDTEEENEEENKGETEIDREKGETDIDREKEGEEKQGENSISTEEDLMESQSASLKRCLGDDDSDSFNEHFPR